MKNLYHQFRRLMCKLLLFLSCRSLLMMCYTRVVSAYRYDQSQHCMTHQFVYEPCNKIPKDFPLSVLILDTASFSCIE